MNKEYNCVPGRSKLVEESKGVLSRLFPEIINNFYNAFNLRGSFSRSAVFVSFLLVLGTSRCF